MASLLKDIYSEKFFDQFSAIATEVIPDFEKRKFKQLIFSREWKKLELKERMRHCASTLHYFMPKEFPEAANIIQKLITTLRQKGIVESGIEYMFLPDYIEVYGVDHLSASVKLMEFVTQFTSCEFAVRPFLLRYPEAMIRQMIAWSRHKNERVRRLASEGSRPRLPWAMGVPFLKKNPSTILPILENLKNDPSEIVRRSVANSLNDISRDHPAITLSIVKKWKGRSAETDQLIKHASRTLLKKGNTDALTLFGLRHDKSIEITSFKILTPAVKIGQKLQFSFSLINRGNKSILLRIEYGLYYRKLNGQLSRKVFKISDRTIEKNKTLAIEKTQSFRPITTRKFYTGEHQLSIIINGRESGTKKFILTS